MADAVRWAPITQRTGGHDGVISRQAFVIPLARICASVLSLSRGLEFEQRMEATNGSNEWNRIVSEELEELVLLE